MPAAVIQDAKPEAWNREGVTTRLMAGRAHGLTNSSVEIICGRVGKSAPVCERERESQRETERETERERETNRQTKTKAETEDAPCGTQRR